MRVRKETVRLALYSLLRLLRNGMDYRSAEAAMVSKFSLRPEEVTALRVGAKRGY